MERTKALLRAHWGAIVLALLLSLIAVAPQLYFRIQHAHDGVYGGIELLPDDPWSGRVREVMDGHPNFGAIYYQDGKEDPYLFQPLGSMAVAYMGKALGLGINNTILLSRLVLPAGAFLLIYSFAYLLWRRSGVALAAASIVLFAEPLLNPSGLLAFLRGAGPANFLDIARPVNPAMILIVFFGFLIAFWLFYKKNDWRLGVVSAALLGLNFYCYFYSWSFLYAFGGLLGLFLLLRKEWRSALGVAAVYCGGLMVAIPYGINLYRAAQFPTYVDTSMRFGVVMTHAPLFWGAVATAAIAVFLLCFPRKDKELYVFALSLLLTPLIALNQQLITGKTLQPAHYHWYSTKPLAVIFSLMALFYLLSRFGKERYTNVLAGFLIAASVCAGAYVQAYSYAHGRSDGGQVAVERQKYGPVMDWLNAHGQKEDVVLGNDPVSYLVTIYTPLNDFYHRAAPYTLAAAPQRLEDVLFTFYRLRGITAKDAPAVFWSERSFVGDSLYGIHYQELLGSGDNIPKEKIDEIAARYGATLASSTPQWIESKLAEYHVSWVVWDTKKDPLWKLDQYPFLTKEVAIGDFKIYRVTP